MRRGGKGIDGGRRGAEPDRSQVIGPGAARILGQPVSFAGAANGVQYPPPWPQRRCTPLFDGPAPQHPRPGPPRAVGQFFRQPRLADPRRPGQHDEPAVAGQRLGQPPPQRGQLPVTPGQDAQRRAPHQPCGHVPAPGARRPRVKWVGPLVRRGFVSEACEVDGAGGV